ncbi:MAG TPA: outer membrane lipoprotein-sorting protein [Thermoanaerobaculia bacterium]|nr:outer membrane lipoprotein-sorting protein [Thermoanaerobaculia bacterium]HUM29255.1 outer membrane lipoprotein-sorting protein [Thermoanaerobaculia bacterium]HXK67787.1 outer membrane lipoprotein-sorting protein [Thermoanaerobaculia bacterium]
MIHFRAGLSRFGLMPFLLLSSLLISQASSDSAREIVERAEVANKISFEWSKWRMVLEGGDGRTFIRTYDLYARTLPGGRDETLLRFLSPAEVRGVGLLTHEPERGDDQQWFYHPATRQIKRIAGSERKNRFMGTTFLYEDLQSFHIPEHMYDLKGDEVIDQELCWHLIEKPLPEFLKETAYGSREIWIGQTTLRTRRVYFFDHNGFHSKTLTVQGVEEVLPQVYRENILKMESLTDGRVTELSLLQRNTDPDFDAESTFTLRSLRQRVEPVNSLP